MAQYSRAAAPYLVAASLLLSRQLIAQRVFSTTIAEKEVATERINSRRDTLQSDATVPQLGIKMSARLFSLGGKPKILELTGESSRGPSQMRLVISDSSVLLTVGVSATSGELKLLLNPTMPTLIFQNYLFSLIGSSLSSVKVEIGNPVKVQVVLPDNQIVQEWTLQRMGAHEYELSTATGLLIEVDLDGEHVAQMRVPAQNLVYSAKKSP